MKLINKQLLFKTKTTKTGYANYLYVDLKNKKYTLTQNASWGFHAVITKNAMLDIIHQLKQNSFKEA